MKQRLTIIISLAIIFLGFFDSNLHSSEKRFGLSMTGGLNPNPGSVQLGGGYPDAKVKSYTTYGLRVNFGKLDLIYSSQLTLSASVNTYEVRSNRSERYPGSIATAQYTCNLTPVLLIAEFYQSGKFGPFIKIGAGAMSVDMRTDFNIETYYNSKHDFWTFAYLLGGGIYYSFIQDVDILLFVEQVIGTREHVYEAKGITYKTSPPYGAGNYGISVRYWF